MSETASTPTTPPFVHLRIHSEFSIVDGTIPIETVKYKDKSIQANGQVRLKGLLDQIQKFEQPAVAVSDLGNMFGFIKLYTGARSRGIKPIAAVDLHMHNDEQPNQPFRVLLIARNKEGYRTLCEIISKAWQLNEGREYAIIHQSWLEGAQGLIVLSGARHGDIGQAFMQGNVKLAKARAQRWAELFPGNFYIELQRAGSPSVPGSEDTDEIYVRQAVKLASELQLPVVATHPVEFLEKDVPNPTHFLNPNKPDEILEEGGFKAHEVRNCILMKETLDNPQRKGRFNPDQYLLSSQEMIEKFKDIPSAIQNTVEIAKRCNLTIQLGKPCLPVFEPENGMNVDDYLVYLSKKGLEKRLAHLYPNEEERDRQRPRYLERLERECNTIIQMQFPGYFLIVQDFINWAKNNGCPVGPGRGSGAGSLVAYALGITDLDPLAYDLLFERFLNPERVSMPDFDVDFCQDNRDRVIEYVKQKYGHDAVSQIATFGTLGAKAVVRDVGRVMNLPYGMCDGLSKMIPNDPADPWSLRRTIEREPQFAQQLKDDDRVPTLVQLSMLIEGLTRNIGMHAGGVLIAPGKLTDFCPLYCQPGHPETLVSQYDKNDVEAVGLVKFDFLGLRNLTILELAVKYVRQFNPSKADFQLDQIPMSDAKTYQLYTSANTTAVFQVESRGMKELLKRLQPSSFEDIIAVLALFRPGPLETGMVEDFVNRKHGKAEVDYFHPDLKSTLESTYGVIVYQEQVMLISQIIGGYSLGGADILRRAMGKKKPEEMAKQRVIFVEGAKKKGYDEEMAAHLFDLMEKFAGYGFNKSHSAAYALVSWQTAWLKTYYTAEFMAATLSSDMDDTDKVHLFWQDCVANGITMLPPCVNASNYRFEPVADAYTAQGKPPRTIRYGLGGIKGVGQAAIENIVAERQANGPYRDLYDFCKRVDSSKVNRRAIEAMIRGGALDALNANRAALLSCVDSAMKAAEQAADSFNQDSLFGDEDTSQVIDTQLEQVKPWNLHIKLQEEKEGLGFYFSHHPFEIWKQEIRQWAPTPLSELKAQKGVRQWIAGVIKELRYFLPKNGGEGRTYIVTLEDGQGTQEVLFDEAFYNRFPNAFKKDQLVLMEVECSAGYRGKTASLRITPIQAFDIATMRQQNAQCVCITPNDNVSPQSLSSLIQPWVSTREKGKGIPVRWCLSKADQFYCEVQASQTWGLYLDDEAFNALQQHPDIAQLGIRWQPKR